MLVVMVYVVIALFGLALGSFTNALVWRVNKQSTLKSAKKRAEYSIMKGRSMCPHCGHELATQDLVPLLSWISLKGRCRYCKKSISRQYPLVELLFATALLFAYIFWPLQLIRVQDYLLFGVFAVILILVFALSIIDIEHQLLPNRLIYPLVGFSVVFTGALAYISKGSSVLLSAVVGAGLLYGIFWVIYQVSDGKWIGGGDVRLMVIIGLLLGWQKGILAIVVASYLATILIAILFVAKRYKKHMRIPFGPFLLTATYLILLFGDYFISLYKNLSGL